MPAGEAFVVVDLRLRLRVLCLVEAFPIGISPATMDNLMQDITVLLLYSVFTPVSQSVSDSQKKKDTAP